MEDFDNITITIYVSSESLNSFIQQLKHVNNAWGEDDIQIDETIQWSDIPIVKWISMNIPINLYIRFNQAWNREDN